MRFPLFILICLIPAAWGIWASWEGPVRGARSAVPSMEWRMSAGALGIALGWLMANLSYSPEASVRVVGFPFPVYFWVNQAGIWSDQASLATLPCLLLNLLLFAFLAERVLVGGWARLHPVKPRRRW